MPDIPAQTPYTGSFVQITNVWDVADLSDRELLVRLYQNMSNMAVVLNNKQSGYFLEQVFATSRQYFNPSTTNQLQLRPGFNKMIDVGAVAAGATVTTAHGLTPLIAPSPSTWKFVYIGGVANDTVGGHYYPIPFASSSGTNNIQVTVDVTNVVVVNKTAINFTDVYIELDWVEY